MLEAVGFEAELIVEDLNATIVWGTATTGAPYVDMSWGNATSYSLDPDERLLSRVGYGGRAVSVINEIHDQELCDWILEASQSTDDAVRADLYAKVQTKIAETCESIFVVQPICSIVMHDYVQNCRYVDVRVPMVKYITTSY